MRKVRLSTIFAVLMALSLAVPVGAASFNFPDLIALPEGFRPEGIARGRGPTFYTGSLADGTVLRGNFRTGETEVLVEGEEGMLSVGMAFDPRSNALFVAGGSTGLARVFDGSTGELLATYELASPPNFINDVIVTRKAAFFTNSSQAVLYRLPLGPRGDLPDPADVEELPLSGEWSQIQGFNANGIEATSSGNWLVVAHSSLGALYRVDPKTGEALEIDLGPDRVSSADGLLFRGSRLYVVRNSLNRIAVVDLSFDLTSGTVLDTITHPSFAVPTTAAAFGNSLYAVNAKFGVADPDAAPYEVVRVPLR